MKIQNLSVKNKQINFENINIDFSRIGIYLIRGANGSGKTSLIEEILFNCRTAIFPCESQSKSFLKSKHNLFTYIPQRIVSTSISVKQYISKGNKQIDTSFLDQLLSKFGLDSSIFNQNFKTLSGGEKEKIAIISGLLKDTPYIFIDEPTNNLDDQSVNQFICLIEELSKSKTIVIVTHDPRINSEHYTNIVLKENDVTIQEKSPKNDVNNVYLNKNKTKFLKLSIGLFKNYINFITLFATIIVILMLSMYTQLQFEAGFSTDEIPPSNVIISYKADYIYGDLNKVYVEKERLNIADDKIYTMISYDAIPSIRKIDGIDKLLIADYEYLEDLNTKLSDNKLLDSINIISLPNAIAESFDQRIKAPYKLSFLENGRFPKDGSSEVAISKSLLIKFFDYNESNVESAMGKSITINQKSYSIVGFYYFDICVLSYQNYCNYGFYEYDPNTYDEFKNRNLSYKTSINEIYPEMTNEVIIFTSQGKEKSVLNYLFENYPADNYYSNEYVRSWVKGFNSDLINRMLLVNILFSAVIGISLMVLSKNNYLLIKQRIYDYENYYIDRRKIKTIFTLFSIIQYCAILILSLVLNYLINSFSNISYFIVIVNVIVVSIFILFYSNFTTYFSREQGSE